MFPWGVPVDSLVCNMGKRAASPSTAAPETCFRSLKRLGHIDGCYTDDTMSPAPAADAESSDAIGPIPLTPIDGGSAALTDTDVDGTAATVPARPTSWDLSFTPESVSVTSEHPVTLEDLRENCQNWYNRVRMARNDVGAPSPAAAGSGRPRLKEL